MKITRDEQTGAMYIAIQEGQIARTIEIEPNGGHVLADIDTNGIVLGVEIIGKAGPLDINVPERIAVEQRA